MESPKKVLIVEDEKNIVDILSFNLGREGYETLAAYDGEMGLKLALEENPDLILLDLMLPKIDGALRAVASGVESVVIKQAEALLDAGGTMIRG